MFKIKFVYIKIILPENIFLVFSKILRTDYIKFKNEFS